jgi:hypothetical protein
MLVAASDPQIIGFHSLMIKRNISAYYPTGALSVKGPAPHFTVFSYIVDLRVFERICIDEDN